MPPHAHSCIIYLNVYEICGACTLHGNDLLIATGMLELQIRKLVVNDYPFAAPFILQLCQVSGLHPWYRKSVFSLNELGQMNGTAGAGGGTAEEEEMPVPHELGEELAYTGRRVPIMPQECHGS